MKDLKTNNITNYPQVKQITFWLAVSVVNIIF